MEYPVCKSCMVERVASFLSPFYSMLLALKPTTGKINGSGFNNIPRLQVSPEYPPP